MVSERQSVLGFDAMTEARDLAFLSDATVRELKNSLTTSLNAVEEQLLESLDSRLNSQSQMLIQLDKSLSSTFDYYSKKICDTIHGCHPRLSLPIQIIPHSFQDPESQFQNLQETDGIVDYHEKFVSICNRGTFSEAYLVGVYLAGLHPEMQTKVRMLMPQNIRQCLSFGKLYESAYPRHPRKLNGNCTDLVSRSMEDAANHKKGMSDASPAYQVFDEMIGPIDDSEISLNSPELLPEEVHNQPEVQTEGYDASICSSKISISAPPYPSSSLSSTTNVLCEDPIDLESIIPDSLSIDEAHSAISTDNKGLLCAGEAFTVVPPLDGVSPFLKVIPCFLIASEDTSQYCVNLVAFATEGMESFNELVESVMSSSDFVMFCSAYHMFDEMPSREYQLFSCTLMDDLRGSLGHYDLLFDSLSFVFDPGKPMTDRLFDPKSAVVLVIDAWLRTFGVSIWSFDHNCFRFFIFDPGIAYTLLLRVLRTRRRLLCCTILSCFTDHWVGTCVHVTSYVCRLADFYVF